MEKIDIANAIILYRGKNFGRVHMNECRKCKQLIDIDIYKFRQLTIEKQYKVY